MSPSRLELLGEAAPMGLSEDPPTSPENQLARRVRWPKRRARRPRSRVCLLKGCERVFRRQQPLTRYCSEACREQARWWRAWKAQRRYRQSEGGKQRRQAQSRRYRERRKAEPERKTAAVSGARVIPTKFFPVLLRPPGVLCGVPAHTAVATAAVLFPGLSPRPGAGSGEGEALAPAAPRPGVAGSPGEKGPAPAAMKAC